MSFALSEEQVSLQESVKDFFETKATSEVVLKAMEQSKGIDKSIYESVCNDLGLASLIIEEQYEGFGASDLELNLAIYEHGYYLAPTPLKVLSYITMLLQECGSDDSKNHILPKISTGVQYGAIVTDQSTLKVKIDKDKISGDIERILFLEDAENLIFVLDDKLYSVALNQKCVEKISQESVDPTQALSTLKLSNASFDILSDSDLIESYTIAKARMTIFLANEMLGAATHAFDMALQYAKDRQQFGNPIGSFQAIKHMLADMYINIEKGKSLCLYAAYVSSTRGDELLQVASMAKSFMSEIFLSIAKENIQIHGGIGFTYEHDAHLFLKRAIFSSYELGSEDEHLEVIAEEIFS